jgi:hypothetical protein
VVARGRSSLCLWYGMCLQFVLCLLKIWLSGRVTGLYAGGQGFNPHSVQSFYTQVRSLHSRLAITPTSELTGCRSPGVCGGSCGCIMTYFTPFDAAALVRAPTRECACRHLVRVSGGLCGCLLRGVCVCLCAHAKTKYKT